ncbi:multidrug efflux system membrane fusion protein [Roseiarcus fermentans]|uniref:Multidrug efflux system membrane fusion protein n=1 Tax=Roseiarcus fermentans TaxID=1473586 RepID=A0A366F202_9HYPH|nr:multidrug transporter subunit MdtN [Roseiarcus fermentans]RBP08702.1 multidrug efflux system membrane fusion protein [Roseiarcus fermentans]
MRAAGKSRKSLLGWLVSLAIIAGAIAFSASMLRRAAEAPATDDATIDADVVHIASAVGGRIVDIAVAENQRVNRGDLLFQIDPTPYRLAADQARADLGVARAALATQTRAVETQRAAAALAADQVRRAEANLDLATRTVARLRPLAQQGYAPKQQLDQAETAERDAATSLRQARIQQAAAVAAIDSVAGAEAAVAARTAALAIAERALDDAAVRAPQSGHVVGLSVLSGEMVAPSQNLFTLVGDEDWAAIANFRETELSAIAVGDCATVYSMIDRARPIRGTVQGVAAGVLTTDRIPLLRSVPYVERSLNWVRVAQRFPVRVRLDNPPPGLMRLGASAVVEVKHGAACR